MAVEKENIGKLWKTIRNYPEISWKLILQCVWFSPTYWSKVHKRGTGINLAMKPEPSDTKNHMLIFWISDTCKNGLLKLSSKDSGYWSTLKYQIFKITQWGYLDVPPQCTSPVTHAASKLVAPDREVWIPTFVRKTHRGMIGRPSPLLCQDVKCSTKNQNIPRI